MARVWVDAKVRAAAAAGALLCAVPALSGCATTGSYAGVPLAPGAADPELQSLARRAQAGDKHAQFELGIRYEEGDGVPVNIERALSLHRAAGTKTPLSRVYSLPAASGVLSSGASIPAIPSARIRYCRLAPSAASKDDCAAASEAEDVLIAISYDLNFRSCADKAGFSHRTPKAYREVRACLVGASRQIECSGDAQAALTRLIVAADGDDPLAALKPAFEYLAGICSFSVSSKETSAAPWSPPAPSRALTPVDAILELQRGVWRRHYERYDAERFLSLMCRLSPRALGFELTKVETAFCKITLSGIY